LFACRARWCTLKPASCPTVARLNMQAIRHDRSEADSGRRARRFLRLRQADDRTASDTISAGLGTPWSELCIDASCLANGRTCIPLHQTSTHECTPPHWAPQLALTIHTDVGGACHFVLYVHRHPLHLSTRFSQTFSYFKLGLAGRGLA